MITEVKCKLVNSMYQIDDTRLIVGGDNTVCIVNIKNCKIETLLI